MSPYLSSHAAEEHDAKPNDLRENFPFIEEDPLTVPSSEDPFTITTATGFLPLRTPLIDLPAPFLPLTKLADELPVKKLDGSPGLLATFQLGPVIDKGEALPDLVDEIDNLVTADGKADLDAVTAVFREYAFIASSYLLEPCWERWCQGLEGYGLGRPVLPRVIAGPLVKTAKMLDIHPFMAYAAAYTLYNYRFENNSIGLDEYKNLRLIRAFQHGLDPSSSEAGFVLTHLDMVKHTGGLIKGTTDILNGISAGSDRDHVVAGLETMLQSMRLIEASMETMWENSRPKDYNTYRTFIFGIKNQSMFPDGVIYEGQLDGRPQYFRGESGANDSIIPLIDSLLQIPMPANPLTEILKDFRSYRPKPHRDFLAYVRSRAEELGVRDYFCGNVDTAVLYLRLLDHVRSFRWRHWLFAREYIIKLSKHPTATGGSPIVTWLPNQLLAVMDLMAHVWGEIGPEDRAKQPKFVIEMMENAADQRTKLDKEVEKYCRERQVPNERLIST